jgi:hypothetical protein
MGRELDPPDGLVGNDDLGPLLGADDVDDSLQLLLYDGDGAAIFSLLDPSDSSLAGRVY